MTTKDFQPTQNMNEETDIQTPTDSPTRLPASAGSGLGTPMTEADPPTGEPTLGRILLQAMMYRWAKLELAATDGGVVATLIWPPGRPKGEVVVGCGRNATEAMQTLNRNVQEDAADEYLEEVGL